MEIPGLKSFSGQPTVTNPLSQQEQIVGQQSENLRGSETKNTVAAGEQETTSLSLPQAVEQTNDSESARFDVNNPGGTIDFTA